MTAPYWDLESDMRLLAERAAQRVHAYHGDLVSRLLVSERHDTAASESELRAAGAVYTCQDGSVAVTDARLGADVLRDARLLNAPVESPGPQYTLPCVDEVIRAVGLVEAPEPTAAQEDVDAAVSAAVSSCGTEFDLVAEVIRPVAAYLLCDAVEVGPEYRESVRQRIGAAGGCWDAALCPPRLSDMHGLRSSLRELQNACGTQGLAIVVLGTELAVNLVSNAALDGLQETGREEVSEAVFRYPPLRLHRRFASEPVELSGLRIDVNTRILVLPAASDNALTGAVHPAVAALVFTVAVMLTAALRPQLRHLRPAGRPVRRLRAPMTRALLTVPVSKTRRGW